MLIFLSVTVILISAVYLFMHQPKFGRQASGERLRRMEASPHFRDGKFWNLNPTPDLAEGVGMLTVLREIIFEKSKRNKPAGPLPSRKTNLLNLDPEKDVFIWFGHSSYFLQIDGKKILVDPVLSGSASPIPVTTRSFPGSDIYTPADFPFLDYLIITHDHWDHLDYETIRQLKSNIGLVICPIGVGAHFDHWGFGKGVIHELDWYEKTEPDPGFVIQATPARHFSGRGFKRNISLWTSFVLQTPTLKIFLGGDSGYDTHFKEIGNRFGPFDFAILECGQYDKNWKYIHMMPEEVVQAALDLHAVKLIPVHWGKFSLSLHAWDDPVIRVSASGSLADLRLVTPLIGEEINLKNTGESRPWWLDIR